MTVKTDILCQKKSQFCANDDTGDIREELRTSTIDFNSCGERFENLGFCLNKSINVVPHQTFPGISLLDIRRSSFSLDPVIIMLLFRIPSFPLNSFYNTLQRFLSTDKVINIAQGDFNNKYFEQQ